MKTAKLLSVLNLLKPAIATKDIVESLTYFYFTGKEVIAYNDQIAISHKLETPFSTFIKAKSILPILSNLTSDLIEFTPKENALKIKAGQFKATLPTIEDKHFVKKVKAIKKSVKKTEFKALPSNFIECLKLCQFTASTSEADGTLTCARVQKKSIVTTDSKRLSFATLKEESPHKFFIKASIISKLIATTPTHIGIGKSWTHFQNKDGCIFSVREIRGGYPEIEELLNLKGVSIDLPKKLIEGLDLLAVFANDDAPAINITLEKNKCTLSVTGESGKAEYNETEIKYKGKPTTISINPEFLKNMMEYTTKMTISADKVLIEVENFKMITALVG